MGTELKKLPGVPKWMYEPPSDKRKEAIKSNSYDFLKGLSDAGEQLTRGSHRVSGYIEFLATKNADFGKIKPSLQKCTYPFIEGVRNELKNKIAKINKELADAQVNQKQEPVQADSQSQDVQEHVEKSIKDQNDDEESSEMIASSSSSEVVAAESEAEVPDHAKELKISNKSKKIKKQDSEVYWTEFGKRHPEKWSELHYLRETIAGKEIELKYWRLKLKQKTVKFLSFPSPTSRSIKDAVSK